MPDFSSVIGLLDDLEQQVREPQLQQKIEAIKDSLGVLQAQVDAQAAAAPAGPAIIPPTAPEVEIIGGIQTDQFPDCCALGDDHWFYCSGTLIAPNVVVTARHCRNVTRVFLGGNDTTRLADGEVVRVAREFAHPDLDLRVLVLERPAKTVTPRHVAQGPEVAGATQATVAGFGTIDLAGKVGYGLKRMVQVPIVSLDGREPGAFYQYGCLPGREMVAGHRGLRLDSCKGDSGGPAYIKTAEGDTCLLAATSRGTREALTTCGDGGIYVRVDLCLGWIREVTGAQIAGPIATPG